MANCFIFRFAAFFSYILFYSIWLDIAFSKSVTGQTHKPKDRGVCRVASQLKNKLGLSWAKFRVD